MTDPLDNALVAAAALTRHNGGMPSRRLSPDEMPERAVAAHQAIAGTARLEILRYLLANPASTRNEIVTELAISPNTARSALLELESLGYVAADVEGERNGKRVRYSAHRSALTDDLAQLFAWILR